MFIITIFVSFLQTSVLISLKFSVGPVGNRHDLEITMQEISMSLIHIDLCHQVH